MTDATWIHVPSEDVGYRMVIECGSSLLADHRDEIRLNYMRTGKCEHGNECSQLMYIMVLDRFDVDDPGNITEAPTNAYGSIDALARLMKRDISAGRFSIHQYDYKHACYPRHSEQKATVRNAT